MKFAPQTHLMRVNRPNTPREFGKLRKASDDRVAAVRARWMAELASAIEGAQRVAWQLGSAQHASLEARELYSRLEAARVELESLRRGTRRLRQELDPWLVGQLGWPGGLEDRDGD
jgi:hypothetical protein